MPPADDPLTELAHGLDLAEEALRQPGGLDERAARLASVLRSLWPDAPFCACRLSATGRSAVCVLGGDGAPAKKAAPAKGGERFPPPLRMPGRRWVAEDLAAGEGHGTLAVALPDEEKTAGLLLGVLARHVAALLEREARAGEAAALRQALAAQTWSANLGVLASPVTHEFNNFLNVVLLQVALLERDQSERRRGEFAVIRQQGKAIAELVRQWQQYRHRQQPAAQPLDLNRAVRDAAEALAREEPTFGEAPVRLAPPGKGRPAGGEVWLRLDLAADLPPVAGVEADLQRLVCFLMANAAAAVASAPGLVAVRTALTEGKVVLRVEDSGPAVDPDLLPQLFEPLVAAREGPNRLELAACKTLTQRRLQGSIHAENRPEGGVAVVVVLKPWG